MGDPSPLRAMALVILAAPVPLPPEAHDDESVRSSSSPAVDSRSGTFGPRLILPTHLAPRTGAYWQVGLGVERFGAELKGSDTLVGLTAQFRNEDFGGHALLESKPSLSGYQDSRFLLGLGFRVHFSVLGARLSYGVGAHGEARLEEHFWLLYSTPVELGGVVYASRSWELELFVGVRRVVVGELIQHFLIDPNGVDNENAQDELDDAKRRWVGFGRLVFSRRVD